MTRRFNLLAWTILAFVLLGMSIYLFLNPTRTGVVPNYRFATETWWDSLSMYPGGTHKFLYSPPFAVLFTLFDWAQPEILGECLWRAFGFGLFTFALRSLSTSLLPPSTFLALVLLSVPASLASLNNGQTNLPLSACLVLAAVALRDQKWNWATVLLSFSLILKPIALAPWLLVFAVVARMRGPLAFGILVILLTGFAHASPTYAFGQWGEFLEKMLRSYAPENLRVSDLFGLLEKVGVEIPLIWGKWIRVGACLGALVWVWLAFRRRGLAGASWAFWVATALVFTVFNPRAETNSYVLISPLLAFAAVSYWREGEANKWKGWALAVACIGLMCDGMGLWIYKATDVWFKPLIVLLASPLLFRMPRQWEVKLRDST